ncbi:MAG: hypothetical protein EPO28_16720, partial [Saprospiraceae bacterium]
IPASITLGQAILESNWGQGEMAINANNFFCIKCNNGWEGETFLAWDDEKEKSCFRSYSDVAGSFSDHSDFLSKNARYSRLFQYEVTNYSRWANGLEECGYATDTLYAEKLIRLIETYALYMYDYAVPISSFQLLTTPVQTEEDSSAVMVEPLNGSHRYDKKPSAAALVMTAPAYQVNSTRQEITELAISQGFSYEGADPRKFEKDKPFSQRRKIRPLYPLPDVKWD